MDAAKRVFGTILQAGLFERMADLSWEDSNALRSYLTSAGHARLAMRLQHLDRLKGFSDSDSEILANAVAELGITLPSDPMPAPLTGKPLELTEGQFGFTPPPSMPTPLPGKPLELTQGDVGFTPPPPPPPISFGKPLELTPGKYGITPPTPMPSPLPGKPLELTEGQVGFTPPPPFESLAAWGSDFDPMLELTGENEILQVLASIADAYRYRGNDFGAYTQGMRDRDMEYTAKVAQMDVSDALKKEALALGDSIKAATMTTNGWKTDFVPTLSFAAINGVPPTVESVDYVMSQYWAYKDKIATTAEFYDVYQLSPSDVVRVQVVADSWQPGMEGLITLGEAMDKYGVPNDMYTAGGNLVLMYY